MTKKQYTCPVCGFRGLVEPPYNAHRVPSHEICPCCGFEFGFDDVAKEESYESFRLNWITNGAQWFQPELKPNKWDLDTQLKNIDGATT